MLGGLQLTRIWPTIQVTIMIVDSAYQEESSHQKGCTPQTIALLQQPKVSQWYIKSNIDETSRAGSPEFIWGIFTEHVIQ
jgi:hypothetical protein